MHEKQMKISLPKSRGRDIYHTTIGKFVEVLGKASGVMGTPVTDDTDD